METIRSASLCFSCLGGGFCHSPSSSSRLAPPPVLTWLTLSSVSHLAQQVAVSPPPGYKQPPMIHVKKVYVHVLSASFPFFSTGSSTESTNKMFISVLFFLPMIVMQPDLVTSTTLSIRFFVPLAKLSHSNTPTGPFHTICLALATASA